MIARPQRAPQRPATRRSVRLRRDRRIGVPLILVALLLLGGLVGAYVVVSRNHVRFNTETNCPVQGPSAITAILFDRTDPINDKQKLFLQNKLGLLRTSAQKFEEVDTYALENQGSGVINPLQQVCNPGKGEDLNSFTGNPAIARERWEKQFDTPLRLMMEEMQRGGGAKTSAIFEAVQSVSLQSFQRPNVAEAPKKLVLVSDLLQFTKTMNLYKGALNYQAFRNTNEALRLRTNLAGVAIEIFFIKRTTQERIPALINFWTDWFIDQGIEQARFKIFSVEG
jgi:hypothetical protein